MTHKEIEIAEAIEEVVALLDGGVENLYNPERSAREAYEILRKVFGD